MSISLTELWVILGCGLVTILSRTLPLYFCQTTDDAGLAGELFVICSHHDHDGPMLSKPVHRPHWSVSHAKCCQLLSCHSGDHRWGPHQKLTHGRRHWHHGNGPSPLLANRLIPTSEKSPHNSEDFFYCALTSNSILEI